MTMRLDLTKRYDLMPGRKRVLISPTPFGCADCGQWFQFARELVRHVCEACEEICTCDLSLSINSWRCRKCDVKPMDSPDAALAAEISRQDAKHGAFSATTELGRLRLAIACLEDEVAEVRDAWREERRIDGWSHTREELLQVAAIAMRILREFGDTDG